MSKPALVCWRVSSKEFGSSKLEFTFCIIDIIMFYKTVSGETADCSQRYVMPAGGNYVSENFYYFKGGFTL